MCRLWSGWGFEWGSAETCRVTCLLPDVHYFLWITKYEVTFFLFQYVFTHYAHSSNLQSTCHQSEYFFYDLKATIDESQCCLYIVLVFNLATWSHCVLSYRINLFYSNHCNWIFCICHCLEGRGRDNKEAEEEDERMQTCLPDQYSETTCPECCVPAIWQPADSNLMLEEERQWADSSVRGLFTVKLQRKIWGGLSLVLKPCFSELFDVTVWNLQRATYI